LLFLEESKSFFQGSDFAIQLRLLSSDIESVLEYLEELSFWDIVGLLQYFDLLVEKMEISCFLLS